MEILKDLAVFYQSMLFRRELSSSSGVFLALALLGPLPTIQGPPA